MSGTIIRLLTPTQYDFTNVGSTLSQIYDLVPRIDVSQWREAVLIIRTHALTVTHTGASVTLLLLAEGYTDEDPTQVFQTPLASFGMTSNDSAPDLKILPIKGDGTIIGNFGGLFTLAIQGTQGGTTGTVQATFSVDLSLKN